MLAEMNCVPPGPGERPLAHGKAAALAKEIKGWTVSEKELSREFSFQNFPEAMAFVEKVASIAEMQGHHPDIVIAYRKVRLTLTTHKIGGLSRNDFIMAAKIDALLAAVPSGAAV